MQCWDFGVSIKTLPLIQMNIHNIFAERQYLLVFPLSGLFLVNVLWEQHQCSDDIWTNKKKYYLNKLEI